MQTDMRDFIPKTTLKRWAGYKEGKKRPLEPEPLRVTRGESEYEVSYVVIISPRNGLCYARDVSVSVPFNIEYDDSLKAAVIAYKCEGDDPIRANGVRIGLNNSDWRIIRLVVNEFEKLGLERERWNVRLELYEGVHDEKTEKQWWSEKLEIPLDCFTKPTWFEGVKGKEDYNPHGRARIQRSSPIFAAIIENTCRKVMRDLLGS
jgi:hypothetical protein